VGYLTCARSATLFVLPFSPVCRVAEGKTCPASQRASADEILAAWIGERAGWGGFLDVDLMSLEPPQVQREATAASATHSRHWLKEPIGASLEEVRGRLSALAAKLRKHVDEHTIPLLEEAQKQLEQASCRIAVIGQIKAGKSTFINALVEHPGLLPSDINPSTAVVTSLHFRKRGPAPEHAAVFQLFSSDEWSDLAEGGGNLRKLTERLVPGFKPELLRAQLEFMRKRAERRLGSDFHQLLGQCHRFKEVTPELLADYVSAGGDYEGTETGSRRRFSDITRTAELFFTDGPFSFPVTLIDTPGNNDPFLVRDEITRRSLDNPDIFVFVLSALQPLSAADISMLRLLNGLHKDRIIVFINRADQLADPVADGATVKSAVEQRLRLEFPALDIPVIIGSCWWGNLSLLAGHIDLRAHLKPSHASVLRGADLAGGAIRGEFSNVDQSRLSRALYASSGMPQLAATVTRLMTSSGTAVLFRQIAACFLEIAKSTEILAKAEFESIEKHRAARRIEAKALGAKIVEEQQSLRLFEERTSALQETFKHIEAHLAELIASGTETLRNDLRRIVHEFSDAQAELVLLSQGRRTPNKTRGCNVIPLRERLEGAYLASFEQMAGDLVRIESFLYPQLKEIIAKLVPDFPSAFLEQPTAQLQLVPSAPLSVTVAFDLDAPWWKLWFATKPSPQEQADHLRNLIDEEFATVVEELVRLAEIRLTERVDYTLQRLKAIGDGVLTGIERRKMLLGAEVALLDGGGDEQSLQRLDSELSERTHACTETVAACAMFGQELTHMIEVLDAGAAESNIL
jgi:signal recognition particle receptor subunit beta